VKRVPGEDPAPDIEPLYFWSESTFRHRSTVADGVYEVAAVLATPAEEREISLISAWDNLGDALDSMILAAIHDERAAALLPGAGPVELSEPRARRQRGWRA